MCSLINKKHNVAAMVLFNGEEIKSTAEKILVLKMIVYCIWSWDKTPTSSRSHYENIDLNNFMLTHWKWTTYFELQVAVYGRRWSIRSILETKHVLRVSEWVTCNCKVWVFRDKNRRYSCPFNWHVTLTAPQPVWFCFPQRNDWRLSCTNHIKCYR